MVIPFRMFLSSLQLVIVACGGLLTSFSIYLSIAKRIFWSFVIIEPISGFLTINMGSTDVARLDREILIFQAFMFLDKYNNVLRLHNLHSVY